MGTNHIFFPVYSNKETHPLHPEQIDGETTLMPLKTIYLCVVASFMPPLAEFKLTLLENLKSTLNSSTGRQENYILSASPAI